METLASTPPPFAQLWPAPRSFEALLGELREDSDECPVRALLAGAARIDRPNMFGDPWYVWVAPRTAREWAFNVPSESPSRTPHVLYPRAVLNTLMPSADKWMDEDVWTPEKIAALTAELCPGSTPEELQAEAAFIQRMWQRSRWVMRALRGSPPGELLTPELRSSFDEERAFPHFAHTPGCAAFWPLALWLLEGSERLEEISAVCAEPLVRDLVETLRQLETGTRETLGKVALRDSREPLRRLLAEARAGREALRPVRALHMWWDGEPIAQGLPDMPRLRSIYTTSAQDISPDIAHLKALEELVFMDSSLVSLRAELFQLPRLRRLHVMGGGVSIPPLGALPEALGNLEQLEELVLWRCGVSRLPGSIGRLRALRWLVVSESPLATLPAEFARLEALEELSLGETQVAGNPEAMAAVARLPRLRRLGLRGAEALAESLAGAQVESLDLSAAKVPLARALPVLEQLPRLRRLVITRSPEKVLPDGFSRLKLEELVVGGDRLQAERVADTLLEMPSLRALSFAKESEEVKSMNLAPLLARLGEFQHLERLDLVSPELRLLRRQRLDRLPRLRHLRLMLGLYPQGGLPEVLHAAPGLESLTLSDAPSEAELWPALREMKGLRRLDLWWSRLKNLPEWIGELSALEELVLPMSLKRLPDELARLPRLRVVVSDIRMRPERLPMENLEVLGKLPALEELVLNHQELTRLPRFLEGAPRLRVLCLRQNDFTAEGTEGLVEFATHLPALRVLALDESLSLTPWRADDVRRMGRLSFLDILSIAQSSEELPDSLENQLRGLLPDTLVCSFWSWRQAPGGRRGTEVLTPGLQHP